MAGKRKVYPGFTNLDYPELKKPMRESKYIKKVTLKSRITKEHRFEVDYSISSESRLKNFLQKEWECLDVYESCSCLFLSNSYSVLSFARITVGGINFSAVDSRMVFKYALDTCASSFIFMHNHPGGTLDPSGADINLTRNIYILGRFLNIEMIDSFIVIPKYNRHTKEIEVDAITSLRSHPLSSKIWLRYDTIDLDAVLATLP